MLGIIDLDDAPRIDSSANRLAIQFNLLLRAYNGKGEESTKLAVVLNGFFVILLNIIGEVVHGNVIVLDILHDLNPKSLSTNKVTDEDMYSPAS